MKNEYEIRDNITAIILKQRNGNIMETIINTEDLPKVLALNLSWHAAWDKYIKGYYCKAVVQLGKINGVRKTKTISLQAVILGYSKKYLIDHQNHNSLDNRKENLIHTNKRGNGINRIGANSNSLTGVRNVCQVGNRLYVQMQVNGKNTLLKKFRLDQLQEAAEYADKARKEIYKY
jgi:hypothetical protein